MKENAYYLICTINLYREILRKNKIVVFTWYSSYYDLLFLIFQVEPYVIINRRGEKCKLGGVFIHFSPIRCTCSCVRNDLNNDSSLCNSAWKTVLLRIVIDVRALQKAVLQFKHEGRQHRRKFNEKTKIRVIISSKIL